MKKFYLKIILPSIISILLFVLVIFFIIIPHFQDNIMDGKREMIKELTNSACSILAKYENDEKNGLLTREEAQKIALSRIQYLRYGEESKDYFWITDMYPKMIMHPYRTDLNNKDLSNFTDSHGKKLFLEFVKTVEKSDYGYVDYMWQWKDDSLHIVPKLSYVKRFKAWDWVIGTGIYIEDVKKEIKALTSKLLWVSTGISLLIGFLLLFISQQSIKIEKKRVEAEKELQRSKEKYRTLVEAATEGLLMMIDGKISFSNNIISKITGYDADELLNKSINFLMGKNHTKNIFKINNDNNIREGQYEMKLSNKNGNSIDVLVTSSNAIFYGKSVSVLIIKDITIDINSSLTHIDYQNLFTILNIGFFKARIDNKGRFISANEKAIRILGYSNFQELTDVYILELFTNNEDKKHFKQSLIESGYVRNKIIKIRKKNNENAILSVTLVVFKHENSTDIICDGIIEDVTIIEEEKLNNKKLITNLKYSNFLLEENISSFVTPIISIDYDSTIEYAIKKMKTHKTDCLLLAKNNSSFIGIITNSDIKNRVLSLKLNIDNAAYLIMSAPINYINNSFSIQDTLKLSEETSNNHLVVKNERNEVVGVVKIIDVYKKLKNSLSYWIDNINTSQSDEELKQCYNSVQALIKPLILSEISVKYITNITCNFSDSIIKRLIDINIEIIGNPPCDFAFICLGSEGRKEETLFTDQDNAIIYENCTEENEEIVKAYFEKLSANICNSLNYVGYAFCKGNIMAKNPVWCQPISKWEAYFRKWISTPDPQNLLEATIFFDFRFIAGNNILSNQLQNSIANYINSQPSFLYHLAHNIHIVKTQQLSGTSIISDRNHDLIDLKNAVNVIIMFARTYSLQNNLNQTNTLERLQSLKSNHIIKPETIDEIVFTYNFLMKLRFRNQLDLLESKQPLTNIINIKKLLEFEISILKKALTNIQSYQSKIVTDFRITT